MALLLLLLAVDPAAAAPVGGSSPLLPGTPLELEASLQLVVGGKDKMRKDPGAAVAAATTVQAAAIDPQCYLTPYTQKVDHFNATGGRTWEQQFIICYGWWSGGAREPVYAYLSKFLCPSSCLPWCCPAACLRASPRTRRERPCAAAWRGLTRSAPPPPRCHRPARPCPADGQYDATAPDTLFDSMALQESGLLLYLSVRCGKRAGTPCTSVRLAQPGCPASAFPAPCVACRPAPRSRPPAPPRRARSLRPHSSPQHRYYGAWGTDGLPLGNASLTNKGLKFLTMQQAMADHAALLDFVREASALACQLAEAQTRAWASAAVLCSARYRTACIR